MKYSYRLPLSLDELVAATGEPDVERLSRLAYAKGVYQAVRDWPHFLVGKAIMEAAAKICKTLLLEETEEGTAVTNSDVSFSLLFLQTYYGAYMGIVETAGKSSEEMQNLVTVLRSLPESTVLAKLADTWVQGTG